MAWKKYFRVADTNGTLSPISGVNGSVDGQVGFRNYQSNLPEVYTGHPNRIERYNQYEAMDMDSEVNACLDIISEFSTQTNEDNNTAFDLHYHDTPTDNEIKIITQQLRQWVKLNEFDKRIFKIFRNSIKYGDQVFVRDPETFKLFWVETNKVSRVIVNESEGKKPEQYIIQDINPNFENLTVAAKTTTDFQSGQPGQGYTAPQTYTIPDQQGSQAGSRFSMSMKESAIDAEHIMHISLTEGLDYNWPFGQSILEQIYKVYKQKELLEDAIIIYRIQRAPERRVFYIDVGNMPSHLVMGFVERVKNEIHQRRIPTQSGGANQLDASYNPMCIDLTTRIPLLDGRTLELTEIINEQEQGKENWIYSCDPVTGKVGPGKVSWAGITRKNAEVIKVHLDNGETLIVTPDHKIPVLGKGFVEASDLTIDESLISYNTRQEKVSNNGNEYEQVFDHDTNEWIFTHRLDSKNWAAKSEEYKKEYSKRNKANVGEYKNYLSSQSIKPILRAKVDKNLEKRVSFNNQEFEWSPEMQARLVTIVSKHDSDRNETIDLVNNDIQFMQLMSDVNLADPAKGHLCKIATDKFTNSKLSKMYKTYNFKNWKDFKSKVPVLNHKIVKIEYLTNKMDTGCLTVENDWHTFATEAGIFIKNSMNEDYFFPQGENGRGSKVETLPGGQNLSDIDDLKYFNNKMARGLRVPSSYLPTGPDDNSGTINDGRMGTALIQEFRFNQYCERLQNSIITKLNEEFKMFLRWRGFNIDAKIFDVKFNNPQNFASYRQTELDATRLGNFGGTADIPYMSKRFALKRFLGLSEAEMFENETLWREENNVPNEEDQGGTGADLRGVGISPGGMDQDLGDMADFEAAAELDPEGGPDEAGAGAEIDVETP